MTDAMMSLKTLVEKTPDADVLREMIGFEAHGQLPWRQLRRFERERQQALAHRLGNAIPDPARPR